MPHHYRSFHIGLIAALLFFNQAVAQPKSSADIDAQLKHFGDLYEARNYTAALAVIEKVETTVKARFGTKHPNYAIVLANFGHVYKAQRKYAEAEEMYLRSLAIRERTLGSTNPAVAATMHNLAAAYQSEGKLAQAQDYYERAVTAFDKALGPGNLDSTVTLKNLADVYESEGLNEKAEQILKRALAIEEKARGPSHLSVGMTVGNLGSLYLNEGKLDEAAQFFQRSLAIREKALNRNDPDIAAGLDNLAKVYRFQGKYAEAERLVQRALAIREATLGKDHPDVALTLDNLAGMYRAQGKYADAVGLLKRALAIEEAKLGKDDPDVAMILHNLALVYHLAGKNAEAETLLQRSLGIRERAPGANNREVDRTVMLLAYVSTQLGKYADAESLFNRALTMQEKSAGADPLLVSQIQIGLAGVYQQERKYADAEALFQRARATKEARLGKDHPDVADALSSLAILESVSGKIAEAVVFSRRTSAAVMAQAATGAAFAQQTGQTGGLTERRADYFRFHVHNLALAATRGIEPAPTLGREGFEIGQSALQSSAGAAVAQMAARFAGSGALGARVREQQDLAASWRERNKALIDALAKPDAQRNAAQTDSIRQQKADIETRLAAAAVRLEKEFPDYAALASPKPLKVEEAQKLLGPDEALVFFLTGDNESYMFALTRDAFDWKAIPLGGNALADKVAAFRRGLNLDELARQIETAKSMGKQPELFDLDLANALYATLLGLVEPLIKDKKQLLIVPSGALTALPFHLLVTEKPAGAAPSLENFAPYRDVAWLIKRQAVTVLPSVTSLKALRTFARNDVAPKPLVGFGDPQFDPNAPVAVAQVAADKNAGTAARTLTTRSYTDFFAGAEIDRATVAQALPPLPDTAAELKAVAKDLGATASDIHLGRDASETMVKRLPLADYRIVYFATHGLVAGDIKGLAEPSLALSIPAQPSDLDDGLLTASEVAQLKLNADWVVLSACNTIAGDKPGAEALSGLARAFFYAGARALLVSHWAVNSKAATRLTTSTFDILKADPKVGRAEALRRAELNYLNDPSDPKNAYPAFWAPFEIVGEGVAR